MMLSVMFDLAALEQGNRKDDVELSSFAWVTSNPGHGPKNSLPGLGPLCHFFGHKTVTQNVKKCTGFSANGCQHLQARARREILHRKLLQVGSYDSNGHRAYKLV